MLSNEDFANVVRLAPLVALDLVLRDDGGSVLVGRRTNDPAKGFLFVPGGIIRKNERLAEAFARIAEAETGLALSIAKARLLGAFDHIYPNNLFGNPGYGTHYVVLAHEVRLGHRPDIRLDGQHSEFRWMSEAELLAAPDVHANTKAYCRK